MSEPVRARVLLRLVPPLVHRANNALTVIQGVLELGGRAQPEERALAGRELAGLGSALARLAGLARAAGECGELMDLCPLVRDAPRTLLRPLAESLGVRLELRADEDVLPARFDARLEPLWIVLVAEQVLALAGAGARRVRLRLQRQRVAARLSLACDADPALACPQDGLAALVGLAREQGWSLRVCRRPRAWGCRLLLSVPERASAAAAPPGRARVLLLQPAGELRELSATVLREQGYGVVERQEWPVEGDFDLVLVDCELARGDPGLLARLDRDGHGPRIACLGRWRAAERVPVLEKPFRPQELLAFVERSRSPR